MNVLQGRYLKRVNSKSGQLKGLKLKTDEGMQTVYLPKKLRTIAQKELALGDALRVWTTHRKKATGAKKGSKASQTLWAIQVIPLSPQSKIDDVVRSQSPSAGESQPAKAEKPPSKKKKKKGKKKKTTKGMTVQLCQKKNCCKRGGTKLWSTFEAANKAASNTTRETSDVPIFKLEAVGCLGGCKHGPNLRFLPDNVKHYHVQPKDVEALLAKHG